MNGKRALVTGGAGFIGSHLCERLLADGYDVLCVDNFYSSTRHNVEHLRDNPRFEILRHDVTFPLFVEVDEIFHLACPASPIYYQRDPVQTTKTAVHGSINMLGLAKRTKARILLSSTSEVYGDPQVHPQSEDYWGNVNPIGPRACYDEGKRAAETLFFDYRRQHDLPIKVVRIFNTYGPRMHPQDGRVVSNFIMSALHGEPLTVYGDGCADPLVLLRRRPRRGAHAHDGLTARGDRTDQPGQPRRVHDARSWPTRSFASSGRIPDGCACRCRRTTRCGASRTSPGLARSWTGSRRSRWPTASSARSSTSGRSPTASAQAGSAGGLMPVSRGRPRRSRPTSMRPQ